MLWNMTMEKTEIIQKDEEIANILKEKYPHQDNIHFKNFFHLNQKEIYSNHIEYKCSYIIQNYMTSNIYLALKKISSGEGFIFDKENNLYLKAHSQMISKLLIDYRNNYIISCSYDKNINIWDLCKLNNNSEKLSSLKEHKGRIYDMDLIINKDELISVGMDKNILLWDIKNFTLIKKIFLNSSIHNLMVRYLSMNETFIDNKTDELIFVYSKNKIIYLINLNNSETIEKFNISCFDGSILLLNNEEYLYQNQKTYQLDIFNIKTKTIKSVMKGYKNKILIIQNFTKGNKIISFDSGNNIKIWNYIKLFCELNIKIDFVLYCLFIEKNGNLFCGSINKTYIYN